MLMVCGIMPQEWYRHFSGCALKWVTVAQWSGVRSLDWIPAEFPCNLGTKVALDEKIGDRGVALPSVRDM